MIDLFLEIQQENQQELDLMIQLSDYFCFIWQFLFSNHTKYI